MAFNKRTWKGRQGVGLNKFSIDGATPVTVVNQPDSLIEAGDALSAGNLNDLETRIDNAFNAVDAEVATKADETEVTDLKNAIDATNARVENLEQEHGSYNEVTAKSPYTIPSGKAKNWSVNVLRGVTRGRNNLLANGNFASATGWSSSSATFSVSDNVATVTPTGNNGQIEHSYTFITGHTYLVFADVKLSSANATTRILAVTDPTVSAYAQSNTNWQQLAIVCTVANGGNGYVMARDNSSQSAFSVRNFVITDLNIYFGTSDLSFLGATDSAKLATIQTNYPELLVPSNYGNSLVDTRYEGVKSTFKNLAQINSFTQSTSYGQTVPCNLRKGVTYTVSGTASGGSTMRLLKSDGSYQYVAITATINATFVAEDDISEASFYGSLTVSNLQIEQGSSKTTFSEYHAPSTLSLPTPITLRSAGSVAEVYDLESGEKTNPLGSVDLGTGMTFYSTSGYWESTTALTNVKLPTTTASLCETVHAEYLPQSYASISGSSANLNRIAITDGGKILINNGSTTTAPSGVLYYALATPNAPTQLDPIQNPYLATESGGTISSILTDAVDDSMTLGYINL